MDDVFSYKQRFGIVYIITNKCNGKIYIGQTIRRLRERYNQHIKRTTSALYPDNIEYQESDFTVEILCESLDMYGLNYCEDMIIRSYRDSGCTLYNKTYGGGNNSPRLRETKLLLSKAHKGRSKTDEHKRKIGESNKGRVFSDETRDKISNTKKNQHINLTDDHKRRISEKMKGENHPLYGKPCSDERKKKISESNKGKVVNEETKKKISESNKGINNGFYGRQHNEETKRKMRESKQNSNYWKHGKSHHSYGIKQPTDVIEKRRKSMIQVYIVYYEDGRIITYDGVDQRDICVELDISTYTFKSFYKDRNPFKGIIKIERVSKKNGFSTIGEV